MCFGLETSNGRQKYSNVCFEFDTSQKVVRSTVVVCFGLDPSKEASYLFMCHTHTTYMYHTAVPRTSRKAAGVSVCLHEIRGHASVGFAGLVAGVSLKEWEVTKTSTSATAENYIAHATCVYDGKRTSICAEQEPCGANVVFVAWRAGVICYF